MAGDVGIQVLVLVVAVFAIPKLMTVVPDFDPLMGIVGLFLLLAVVQQLGFQTPSGSGEGARPAHRRAAGEDCQEASGSAPTAEHLVREAEKALGQNSWARVQELAKRATDLDPESARAWELLATAQKWEGRRDEAAATVRKARDIYEVDSDGLRALARDLESLHSPAAAAAECEGKGEAFFANRQYDLAAECYSKALDALSGTAVASDASSEGGSGRPLRLRLLQRRAECAQQRQDWGTCRSDTTALLEADPNDRRALMQRAAANEALEKFAAALEDARRLLALDPKSVAANRIAHNCQQALRS